MFKNIASNWGLNFIRIAVLLHLTPFVIGALGPDQNGVWVTIVSTTGLLKLMILGVPMASVRYLARALAEHDREGARRAVSTCLGMCLTLGAAAAVIGGLLYLGFSRLLLTKPEWQALSPETLASARAGFGLIVLQVSLGFAGRLPYALFDAHHDFIRRNAVMLGELLLRWSLTVLLLSLNASILCLAAVQIVCMASEFTAALILSHRRWPWLRFSLASFDRSMIGGVLSFSLFAMLLNLGALLAFRIDALVIGAFLSPAHVTQYDLGNKFWEPLMEFLIGIGTVVMPMATHLSAQGRAGELRAMYEKWTKVALSVVLFAALYLVVLGPEFMAWWVGEPYRTTSGTVLRIVMLSALVFLPARGVALPILMGLGKPRAPALAFTLMALLNLGLSVALVRPLGIAGVALGTALPNVLFGLYLSGLTFRELDVQPRAFAAYVGGRALPGLLLPLAVLLLMKAGPGAEGLPGLLLAGALSGAAYALVWILFVFRSDPHLDLYALARARLSRGGSA